MNAEALIQRAIEQAKAGNMAEAKGALVQLVKQEPRNARAWYLLSQVVENKEQAEYCLNKTLEIEPGNVRVQWRLQTLREDKVNGPVAQTQPAQKAPAAKQGKKGGWGKWVAAVVGVAFLLCVFVGILLAMVPFQDSSTAESPTALPIILDAPALFGKSLAEIRLMYSVDPLEELHPLTGYEDILPSGTQSEGYINGEYSFYMFYDKNLMAVGIHVYGGLESYRLRVRDWNKLTKMFNLSVDRNPDLINDNRAEWSNYSGYHIEIVRNLGSDFVFLFIVVKYW